MSICAWFQRLFRAIPDQRQEQEFSAELESHLQLHIDDNLRAGMSPPDARRSALLKLGGVEHTKQAHRERRTFPFLQTVLQADKGVDFDFLRADGGERKPGTSGE